MYSEDNENLDTNENTALSYGGDEHRSIRKEM